MLKIFLNLIINILIILGLSSVLESFNVDNFFAAGIFLIILTIFNWTMVPIIKIFTLPITFLTLGLFNILINLAVILVVANIVEGVSIQGSVIDNLATAALISVVLTAGNILVHRIEKNSR